MQKNWNEPKQVLVHVIIDWKEISVSRDEILIFLKLIRECWKKPLVHSNRLSRDLVLMIQLDLCRNSLAEQ